MLIDIGVRDENRVMKWTTDATTRTKLLSYSPWGGGLG